MTDGRITMLWLALWIAVLAVAAFGLTASANRLRFDRRVAQEARRLWAGSSEPRPVDRERLATLPTPVRRYLEYAVGDRAQALRRVRLRHRGTFRPKLDGGWLRIRGVEYLAADPPGFVWCGRVGVAPGLWVEALDRSVGGVGSMLVRAESTFTLDDRTGPDLDQGALLRLLAEMPWLPTALTDDRYVAWTAGDDRRAEATLRVSGREVAGRFEFGEDGWPTGFSALRYRDLGNGQSVLTPWSGRYADYRAVHGVWLPREVVVSWHVDGQELPYAHFLVDELDLDPPAPY